MISPVQLAAIALGLVVTGGPDQQVEGTVNFTATIVPTELLVIDAHDLGSGYEAVVARLDKMHFLNGEKTPLTSEIVRYAGDQVLFVASATDPELEARRYRHDGWPRAIPKRLMMAAARVYSAGGPGRGSP